jgi:hemerythrin
MLEWKPEYSVGVAKLDTQHRKLFDYVNELEQAMRKGQGRAVLDKILANLSAYTREHFATEEELMRRTGYPAYAQHKAAHETFVKRVREFEQSHKAGEVGVTVELVS